MAELTNEIRAHRVEAGGLGETFAAVGEKLKGFGELAGVAFGAETFKDWIAETDKAAEETTRMAVMLGTSTAEVQRIGAVAALTGADMEKMGTALERLQLGLAKSGSATSAVAAALKALGIEAEHFRSLSIPEQLDELAEAASRFADSSIKPGGRRCRACSRVWR